MAQQSDQDDQRALAWQTGVWDSMADVYLREIDRRFQPVVEHVIHRAKLVRGDHVLDLGTGTGSVALRAAPLVMPDGDVLGLDISNEMLALAQHRAAEAGLQNVSFREGRAEEIPAEDRAFDVVLASLSFMYVIDRRAAAHECARVLRPGGRLVASAWAGPAECDIVRFQQTVGQVAPAPPVTGVGPGALADVSPFLEQLAAAGIAATVESTVIDFEFDDVDAAWDILAGVTARLMEAEQKQAAREALLTAMWPMGDGPRTFHNLTQFILGEK